MTWQRGAPKVGDGKSTYSAATERLLIFAMGTDPLVNHDGSARNDVVKVPVTLNSYARLDQHLFQKPADFMRLQVSKPTHAGELVIEPFGGTGSSVIAAA